MLEKILVYNFELKLLSGLHIGGSADVFDIGGADSTVIKNPISQEPYIPGSSLKGKVRALLCQKYGEIQGDSIQFMDPIIQNLFEPVPDLNDIQISRAIFRDSTLTEASREELERYLGKGVYTEIKAENKIKPLSGTAEMPRFIERVPAGAVFEGQIVLQIFQGDDEEKLRNGIEEGIRLLENNYLGGSGTRGYGSVKIDSRGFEEVKLG